jgi:hypothetical protein
MGTRSRDRRARKGAVIGVVFVVMFAMAGCDRFSTFDRLGVTIDTDESIQILYLACDYELVEIVELIDGHDPALEEDDELLWQIRSDDGAPGGVFTVGSEHDGFVETVGFEGQVGGNLIASVGVKDAVGAAMTFAPSELEAGMIQTTDESAQAMTASAFEESAGQSCGSSR